MDAGETRLNGQGVGLAQPHRPGKAISATKRQECHTASMPLHAVADLNLSVPQTEPITFPLLVVLLSAHGTVTHPISTERQELGSSLTSLCFTPMSHQQITSILFYTVFKSLELSTLPSPLFHPSPAPVTPHLDDHNGILLAIFIPIPDPTAKLTKYKSYYYQNKYKSYYYPSCCKALKCLPITL